MPPSPPHTARELLIRGFARHKQAVFWSLIFRSIHQIGELGVPLLIGVIIDQAITTGETDKLIFWIAVLGADFLLLSLGWRFGSRFEFDAMQREMHQLRYEIAAHILHDRGARAEQLPGELLSVATSDAERAARIRTATSFGFVFGSSSLVGVMFLAIVAGVGGNAAFNGDISIGELVAIVGLVQFLAEPVTIIGEVSAEFGRARASAQRIVNVLATPRLITLSNGEPAATEG